MRRPRFFIVAAWASGTLLFVAATAAADTKTAAADFFQQQVAPLLTSKCLSCHGSDAKGELDLRSGETAMAGGESGPVILPGKPQESLLYEHVAAAEMPPEEPLSSEEIAVLRRWIEKGAYYPDQPLDPLALSTDLRAGYDWWSLQPLKAPEVPTVGTAPKVWQKSPIDRFIFKKLQAAGLPGGDRRRRAGWREGLCGAARATARLASLRRTLGPPLAGRSTLRRKQRL
jgi:mono/diheme cytochrome c family protein